eukprot:scaffold287837_cov17-Tisochrysis_lutea.AAC.1
MVLKDDHSELPGVTSTLFLESTCRLGCALILAMTYYTKRSIICISEIERIKKRGAGAGHTII